RDDCCVTRSGHNIAVTARTALRERPFAGHISQARPQFGRSRRVSNNAAYGAERHDMHRRLSSQTPRVPQSLCNETIIGLERAKLVVTVVVRALWEWAMFTIPELTANALGSH